MLGARQHDQLWFCARGAVFWLLLTVLGLELCLSLGFVRFCDVLGCIGPNAFSPVYGVRLWFEFCTVLGLMLFRLFMACGLVFECWASGPLY